MRITVLGAGIIGLSTAVCLQDALTASHITLIADRFDEETLSDGAGGIFRPSDSIQGPEPDSAREWVCGSYRRFSSILRTSEASTAGIQEVSGFMLTSGRKEILKCQLLRDILPSWRDLTSVEMDTFPGTWKNGVFYTTMVIDTRRHLAWLRKIFEARGGKIVQKTVESFEELSAECDLIVNCCGLLAGRLANDSKLVPLRGQVFKVKAPWIKHFYYSDLDTYIIPGIDTVTLGGTRQYHSYNENVDKYDSAAIWERCTQLIPSLKNAKVEREWVGLRPHRDPVRLELELLNVSDKTIKVIHNYGHGGYGVTLSWGCAENVVRIVRSVKSSL